MASHATVTNQCDEIEELKTSDIIETVKVIKNVGEYENIVTTTLKESKIIIKFQLPAGYPKEKAIIFIKSATLDVEYVNQLTEFIINFYETSSNIKLLDICKEVVVYLINNKVFTSESPLKSMNSNHSKIKKEKVKTNNKDMDDNAGSMKKKKLRTAGDVVKRILWDDVPIEHCYIGYMDRFVGLVEKSFNSFSWEDIASVDLYTLAIPKHRIVYFKFKKLIIWDKRTRLDNVFGTGDGTQLTLTDVIASYDELIAKDENLKKTEPETNLEVNFGNYDNAFESPDSDDSDEDIVLQQHNNYNRRFKNKEEYFGDKVKPNYFLCLKINSQEIINNVKLLQNEILQINPEYVDTLISPDSLHVTLSCLGLDNDESLEKAIETLNDMQQNVLEKFPKLNETMICLKDTDHFWNSVLYAVIEENEMFLNFVKYVRETLVHKGIEIRDMFEMKPHMTLMKISRQKGHKLGCKYLDARVHMVGKDKVFGCQLINNINLCLMGQQRQGDGFYVTPVSINF